MRLFVAIGADDLNFDPVEQLKKIKVNLNKKEIEYRWIPQANYHITLNFLGEVGTDKVDFLSPVLEELGQAHSAFHLKLHGVGAFPTAREGRVIWMGVQNSMALRGLQSDSTKRLKDLGFELEERAYSPHLTLARLRNHRHLSDVISPLKNHHFGEMAVRQIILYESKAGGAFPVYEPLFKFPLRIQE